MARKPKAYVFDSWAVLAYLQGEPSGEAIADLIVEANENASPLLMSAVNAGEVWYILAREISTAEADKAIQEVQRLGIEVADVAWPVARVAAGFKTTGKISYADCFAAALASDRNAELVTGDREFKQVEGQVKIHWV